MPRRLLSSRLTFFYKFVLPLLFSLGIIWSLAVMTFGMGIWTEGVPSGFLSMVIVVSAINLLWMGWLALRSHKVEADAENFYVSNFRKEIVIPRADLYEATEMRWFQPYWITLRLRRPSEFGDRVNVHPAMAIWCVLDGESDGRGTELISDQMVVATGRRSARC